MTPAKPMFGWLVCSKCDKSLDIFEVPAVDALRGTPVCNDCARIQRHVRRKANS